MMCIEEHDVTVHIGHVRDVLPSLDDASVQCIVTSPPYYGLRDYGVDGQIGLEPTPAAYVEAIRATFSAARRVLADDGVLWLNLGDSYSQSGGHTDHGETSALQGRSVRAMQGVRDQIGDRPAKNMLGMPWRVAFALQDDGWILRNEVIWNKTNAMPESVTDRLSTRHEKLFLFSKSRRYWFDLDAIRIPHAEATAARYAAGYGVRTTEDQANLTHGPGYGTGGVWTQPAGGRNPGDVWTIPTSPFPGAHFAVMPRELARRCILAGCPQDGTVLDPFTGSGTTLMAARQLGRRSVGIELNPDYLDIITERIGQAPLEFGQPA